MKNTRGLAQRLGADSPQGAKKGDIPRSDHVAQRTKHTINELIHIGKVVALAENFFIEYRGHLYE